MWDREYQEIRPQLEKANERDIDIINFSFTDIQNQIGNTFCYGIDEQKLTKNLASSNYIYC